LLVSIASGYCRGSRKRARPEQRRDWTRAAAGLRQRFPQEELGVPRWVAIEGAEQLIALPLVKRHGLKAVRLERRPTGAARAGVVLGMLQKLLAITCPASSVS